jgi:hypothetical protein
VVFQAVTDVAEYPSWQSDVTAAPWAFPMKSALSGSPLRDVQYVTRLPVRAVMPRPNVVLAVPEVRGWHDRPGGAGARTIEVCKEM